MITQPIEPILEPDEQWRKSIPAQVFLNHFYGMDFYVSHKNTSPAWGYLSALNGFKPKQEVERWEQTKKWLLNAWNAEYTLRTVAIQTDVFYQQHALHWVFPQAYYSILYSGKAFLAIQGINNPAESVARQILNIYVQKGWYPRKLSFYAEGAYGNYTLKNLPVTIDTALLQDVETPKQAIAQVAQFLCTTRDQKLKQVRQRLQANPAKAFKTKSGKILTKFTDAHWQELSKKIGSTTFFDMMARLKVSGTQRELERFVEANIDLVKFHKALLNLMQYINKVHEAYIIKAVGIETYTEWLNTLPEYLKDGFPKERTNEIMCMLTTTNKVKLK